jgi:hypothetical protein
MDVVVGAEEEGDDNLSRLFDNGDEVVDLVDGTGTV